VPFNGDRLRILRRFHDLTQRGLGELVGSSASVITGYERGQTDPKGIALDALCAALHVDQGFFFVDGKVDEFQEPETNFRSLAKTPDRLRKKVLAHATLFGTLLELLTTRIRLPRFRLPTIQALTRDELERAAERCRIEWGVGTDAPIHNVMHMIESAGVVVTILDAALSKMVDAFSRYGRTNLVVLNPAKGSATRARFDLAHEAAHGVLHSKGLPVELELREEQANYFASAVLLPHKAFAREFWAGRHSRSWEHLFELKQRWGASIPAIVSRSYHLGLMDAAEYRRRYKQMSQKGWLRGQEPSEPHSESPQLFSLMMQRYQSETRKSTLAIAEELNWTPGLFRQVTGLEATEDTGGDGQHADATSVASFEEYRLRKMSAG
jgi:Zn-dependent peptidase ImmA (M78 family)/transcriptional regulator with XRE-family HTH domain